MVSLLSAIFFLAGASSLAYQIIWIRLFGLVFGGTVRSMSVVVAVFMGGLALGSHVIGTYAVKIGNRVRLFGYLEVALGTLAILVFYGISYLAPLIYSLPFNNDIHSFQGLMVRIILSTLLLLLPTMIMGGTLPVLVRAITEKKDTILVNMSILYAINALGAMTGAFLVGFVMIRHLGVSMSNLLAASVEIGVGIVALIISGRFESTPDAVSEDIAVTAPTAADKGVRFYVSLGITGFVGLTLEIVWLRMLLLVVNNTIYPYTIVISVFLLGLGLGGLFLRYLTPRRWRTEKSFGVILALMSFTIAMGFILYPATTSLTFGQDTRFLYDTFFKLSTLTTGIFILLGFAPVFLMGMSLPLGIGLYAREVRGLSRKIGMLYAVNTAGSLAGSLAGVFILIPAIGIRGTIILCTVLVMVPGLYFISRERKVTDSGLLLYGSAALLIATILVSLCIDVPRSMLKRLIKPTEYIEYLSEGPSSTIWITNGDINTRKVWIDNLWVASTSTMGTHSLTAYYPVFFCKNPKNTCGIAFGTGQTFGATLLFPIERLFCVEIDSEVIKAAKGRFTKENFGVLEDPRSVIVIDDGRFFLEGTREKFDIITAEPLQPYTRGTVNLYTKEFYEACYRDLKPGGTISQWMPTYNSGVADTWSMIRTFVEVFDYALLFMNGEDGIIVGSNAPLTVDPSMKLPDRVVSDLKRIGCGNLYSVLSNYICSRDKLLEASKNYPLITDNHPILEFTAPISHWNQDITGPIEMRRQLLAMLEPLDTILVGNVDWELANRYRESRTLLNRAYLEEKTGFFDKAHELYGEAFRLNPEDERVIWLWFVFLRRTNRVNMLPPELRYLVKPGVIRE